MAKFIGIMMVIVLTALFSKPFEYVTTSGEVYGVAKYQYPEYNLRNALLSKYGKIDCGTKVKITIEKI